MTSTTTRTGATPAVAPTPIDAARYARLEAENRRLAEENAFLKKAAAFFAKEQL